MRMIAMLSCRYAPLDAMPADMPHELRFSVAAIAADAPRRYAMRLRRAAMMRTSCGVRLFDAPPPCRQPPAMMPICRQPPQSVRDMRRVAMPRLLCRHVC